MRHGRLNLSSAMPFSLNTPQSLIQARGTPTQLVLNNISAEEPSKRISQSFEKLESLNEQTGNQVYRFKNLKIEEQKSSKKSIAFEEEDGPSQTKKMTE